MGMAPGVMTPGVMREWESWTTVSETTLQQREA